MRGILIVLIGFVFEVACPPGIAAGLIDSDQPAPTTPFAQSTPTSPYPPQASLTAAHPSCLAWTGIFERSNGIPAGLLTSISFVESAYGNAPWPWTLNIAGTPYYFPSRDAAAKMIRDSNGHIRPDVAVGCMQILMKAHAQLFANPEDLLDPRINVAYAGQYLARLHDIYKSWTAAVSHYGAIGLVARTDYVCKVLEYRVLFGYQPLNEAALNLCRGR
jgi:hypothetical protein